ncbi:hypothetical protein DFH08DRAFT_1030776 [Mycena albidolilacea]|uniref:Uncharacterized protein n=1 Tax=Mycena albidolilacea TaxID=1033008 RepID=A0AAD7AJD1_9AGAR|nr:hypothetical protein DFH08DRAFT_1030776 [Mycena albidolilacea]
MDEDFIENTRSHSSKAYDFEDDGPPWLLCDPVDTTRAPLSQLAPNLSSFSLEPNPYYACTRQIDPFHLGLAFAELTELEIFVPVHHKKVYEMHPSLCCLKSCALHIDANTGWEPLDIDEELGDGQSMMDLDADDFERAIPMDGISIDDTPGEQKILGSAFGPSIDKANLIILLALTNLHLVFSDYTKAATVFEKLRLPALTHLTLATQNGPNSCCPKFRATLLDFFRCSRTRLSVLELFDIGDLSQTQFRELAKGQRLERFKINECYGDFWKALGRSHYRSLFPVLTRFSRSIRARIQCRETGHGGQWFPSLYQVEITQTCTGIEPTSYILGDYIRIDPLAQQFAAVSSSFATGALDAGSHSVVIVILCQKNMDLPHVYRCLVRFPATRRFQHISILASWSNRYRRSFHNKAAKVNAGRLQVPQPDSLVGSRIHLGNGRSWSRRRVIALKDLSCRGF